MVKPKLLVIELWGLGDLCIATPFLQAASDRYEVTLVAKPYAQDLQKRLWSNIKVVPFVAPWTAFEHKYRLLSWPWWKIIRLRKELAGAAFEFGLSARWDPRDHLLLRLAHARSRLGFPRLGSQIFLSRPLRRPVPHSHRYENWRVMADSLGFQLPPRESLGLPQLRPGGEVLVHSGAGQPVRVWPLERYRNLVTRLRQRHFRVQVACDPDQQTWWLQAGEKNLCTPKTVAELFSLLDRTGAFIGNDSGPGHLAAFCGVPTFTLFGPQLPEWFAPLHQASEWVEGKACPYRPCSDYCRFSVPCCIVNHGEDEVWSRVDAFLAAVLAARPPQPAVSEKAQSKNRG
jgi:ADP-heptose:LPS heptosyltransferase